MKVEDLEWDNGRAVVQINNEMSVSIITPERDQFIRQHMLGYPTPAYVDVVGDGTTTWEIAFIQGEEGDSWTDIIPEFTDYLLEDTGDGWYIYGNVPVEKVMEFINSQEE